MRKCEFAMRFTGFLGAMLLCLFAFPLVASRYGADLGPPLTGLYIWTADVTVLLSCIWIVLRSGLRNFLGVVACVIALLAFLSLAVLPLPMSVALVAGWYWCVPLGVLLGFFFCAAVIDFYHACVGNP